MRARRRELLGAGDAKGLAEDLEGGHRVCVLDRVADGAWVLVDLVVVATLEELVAEKVDLVKVGLRQVPQAEGLVPARREEVERDLPRAPRERDVGWAVWGRAWQQRERARQLGLARAWPPIEYVRS